jgi:hypothetical protein
VNKDDVVLLEGVLVVSKIIVMIFLWFLLWVNRIETDVIDEIRNPKGIKQQFFYQNYLSEKGRFEELHSWEEIKDEELETIIGGMNDSEIENFVGRGDALSFSPIGNESEDAEVGVGSVLFAIDDDDEGEGGNPKTPGKKKRKSTQTSFFTPSKGEYWKWGDDPVSSPSMEKRRKIEMESGSDGDECDDLYNAENESD